MMNSRTAISGNAFASLIGWNLHKPDAVAAVFAHRGDAAQLLVVHQLLAARDGGVIVRDFVLRPS